jgi:DNA-binding response OmpR family regulator
LDANEFLTAPYDPSGLLSKVRKLLQRQPPQIAATVLVVNSDEERCATLKDAFQNRGYQVDLAGTAGEVEQRLEICAPDFAVLFPNLEDTTPGELLERVKTQGPATIVILVTEETDTQRSVDLVKKRADGFVREPLNVEHLN